MQVEQPAVDDNPQPAMNGYHARKTIGTYQGWTDQPKASLEQARSNLHEPVIRCP
jgi:hypothetical protein